MWIRRNPDYDGTAIKTAEMDRVVELSDERSTQVDASTGERLIEIGAAIEHKPDDESGNEAPDERERDEPTMNRDERRNVAESGDSPGRGGGRPADEEPRSERDTAAEDDVVEDEPVVEDETAVEDEVGTDDEASVDVELPEDEVEEGEADLEADDESDEDRDPDAEVETDGGEDQPRAYTANPDSDEEDDESESEDSEDSEDEEPGDVNMDGEGVTDVAESEGEPEDGDDDEEDTE